jgi:hypothetical protein
MASNWPSFGTLPYLGGIKSPLSPLGIEGILYAARSAEKNLEIFGGDLQPFKG